MRLTNLLRWFFTRSYSCWNSFTRCCTSFRSFFRSRSTMSLTWISSTASFHLVTCGGARNAVPS